MAGARTMTPTDNTTQAYNTKVGSPTPDQDLLSAEHLAEIVEGSGVNPDLVQGRYRSITAEGAKALGFSDKQARPGWCVELVSPTGEVGHQLKPDEPRAELKNGKRKPIRYETPLGRENIISVHPSMSRRLAEGKEPVWVVEGAKKGDCLASRNRLTVALTGVWNWGKKREKDGRKYGRPELLPDWGGIPLEGRKVYVCFDADFREKRGVALAITRLAERLTERGAHAYVVWLSGPEKGVDDYLVAGGDLDQLEKDATSYQACDFTPHIARDSKNVRQQVANTERRMALDRWPRMSGKTDHSLMRTFLELFLERGKENDLGEIEVWASLRELQERAEVGSRKTLGKSIARLEDRGYITKVPGDANKGKANIYRLIPTKVNHIDRGAEVEPSILHTPGSPLSGYAPHLRWPAPPPREDALTGYIGSRLPHLGKTRELILHLLSSWGGRATMRDLADATGVGDTTHLRNRHLEEFDELGIVELPDKGSRGDKAVVRLTNKWRRRLDERREMGGELSASRRRVVKNSETRHCFYNPPDADEVPPLPPVHERERILEERRRDDERARVEEQRRKVGVTAEVFVHDRLTELGKIRFGLLREVWRDSGGDPRHIWPAVRGLGCEMKRLTEFDNSLFVYPPEET
jgi:Domain of unknown function (DUF3854)